MLFFFVFILLVVGAYLYIGIRYIRPAGLSHGWNVILWLTVAAGTMLPFLHALLMFRGSGGLLSWIVSLAAYGTLGFMSILLFPTVMRDAGYAAFLLFRRFRGNPLSSASGAGFIRKSNSVVLVIAVSLMGYGLYGALKTPSVRTVYLPVENLPPRFEEFCIVQLTDLHIGSVLTGRFLARVVDRTNALEADIIVITGDLVDGSVQALRDHVDPIARLQAPFGVYFTTGNHEYYSGAEEWVAEIRRLGIDVLMNEYRTIAIGADSLVLAGVSDYSAGSFEPGHRSDPEGAIAGAPSSAPSILFAHQPRSIYNAAGAGYDVQISGHTHGGQYIPWNLFVSLQQPYTSGLHRYHDTLIYVSTGTGVWGPPLRIGIPSEITRFILTREE